MGSMGSDDPRDPAASGGRRYRDSNLSSARRSTDQPVLDPRRLPRTARPPPTMNDHPLPPPPPLSPLPPPPQQEQQSAPPSSKSSSRLERRSSKLSLFNLFSRPKVERARGHHEAGLPAMAEIPEPSSAAPGQPQQPQPKPVLRVTSPNAPTAQPQPPLARAQIDPSKLKPLVGSLSKRSNWDPPPLFQAYPQALKHATLQSSIPSAEAVLKIQQQRTSRRPYSLLPDKLDSRNRLDLPSSGDADKDDVTPKKQDRTRLSSKRLSSAMLPFLPEMNKKIYVLVTSGYVLQYAGDGPFDRLPEKMLQLGPESACFASDLIPGKHWVLQISQVANEDGTVTASGPRSFLAKLRLQNSNARRHVSNFLLILESAEAMDEWLTSVKNMIDALGGVTRKDEAEVKASTREEPAEKAWHEKPSHRYLVQRDNKRFSGSPSFDRMPVPSPSNSPIVVASDWEQAHAITTPSLHDVESFSARSSRRASVRQSFEITSPASTAVSSEHSTIGNLSAGSRLSVMSAATSVSATVTLATSRGSSPTGSPRSESFPKSDMDHLKHAAALRALSKSQSPPTSLWRRSMQALPPTDEDVVSAAKELQTAILEAEAMSAARSPVIPNGPMPEKDHQQETTTPAMRRNRSPKPRTNSIAGNRGAAKYRSSSLPPPQIPLPPLPTEGQQRLESKTGRPQSIIGGLPPSVPHAMHSSIRRSPSPLPPTIAEDAVDEKVPESPPLPDSRQSSLDDSSNTASLLSRTLEQPEKRVTPNFSLPTSPKSETYQRGVGRPMSLMTNMATVPAQGSGSPRSTNNVKPYFRPVPIRSAEASGPRRHSSLLPPPLPLAVSVSAGNTVSRDKQNMGLQNQQQQQQQQQQQVKTLKRPTSMQIRSDRTPFLAAARNYSRSVSANAATPATATRSALGSSPSPPRRLTTYDILTPPPFAQLRVQRSMPAIPSLPPVGPPPDMPLPPPPTMPTATTAPIAV